jgi:hypothetical protein
MPMLRVSNDFNQEIPGLGKNTPFGSLSEKRITKATRECLRVKYGEASVEVSCSASFRDGVWTGRCWINGTEFVYRILPNGT